VPGKTLLLTFLLLPLLWLACENPNAYRFEPKLVVNGELTANQPIASIFVSWSADITQRYNTEAQRVHGADVRLNGVLLKEYPRASGVYYYPDTLYRVESGKTYRLEVRAEGEYVFSETTVPPPFHFNPLGVAEGDTVQYIPGDSWFSPEFFQLTWPNYTHSKIYRIVSLAEQPTPENFIVDDRPEARLLKGPEEERLNPAIWWTTVLYVRINWMYFNWTGWHKIIVSAMDENYYDYRQGILFGEQYGQNFNTSASDTLRVYLTR